MNLAPILLFVYNRPWHTQQTLEALAKNEYAAESDLIVFADGPKNSTDVIGVQQTRAYLNSIKGFKTVSIHCKEKNQGLANSIISGVNQAFEQHDTVIVVEDDLLTSPHFLRFLNEGLNKYEKTNAVISIHGYSYPCGEELPETYFLKGADCWGWATWKESWLLFEPDGNKLLAELEQQNLVREFNFNNAYDYHKMLQKQVKGENSSWAIRWYAAAFLSNKLTLYPGKSLVHNIGNDNSGTHSKNLAIFDTTVSQNPILINNIAIEEDKQTKNIISNYLKKNKQKLSLLGLLSMFKKRIGI